MSLRLRRGGNVAPPAPPSQIYGPTAGTQAIRDGAAPQAVTDPGGGITFTTMASLSTAIGANPAGSKFVHAAGGTEAWGSLSIAAGKQPKIYFLGLAGSTATTITGGGTTIGFDFTSGVGAGGEIHGGTYTGFGTAASPTYAAVIIGRRATIVEDCKFDTCYRGIAYDGTGALGTETVRYKRCYAVNCLRYGFTMAGFTARYPEVSYCHWKNCNTSHFPTDDDAGGSKFLATSTWVHHCWAEGNYGSGIWTDASDRDVIIEENVSENNTLWGIFYEIGGYDPGWADAHIQHNALFDNALGATDWYNSVQLLAACDDGLRNGGDGFEINNNYIDGAAKALGFLEHGFHPYAQRGFYAHDNDIWMRGTGTGRVGGEWIVDGPNVKTDPFAPTASNRFEANQYHVTDTALAKWRWAGVDRTWVQWQAYGHDDTGSLVTI